MQLHDRKVVTLVAEAALERTLVELVERLGASGCTVGDVRGRGQTGERAGGWAPGGNVRVEVICDEATARAIVAEVASRYSRDYALVLTVHDVQVLRPDKF